MKKLITIYLVGVALCFLMAWNTFTSMKHKYNAQITYGDVVATAAISITSWLGVTAIAIFEITTLDLWDKPI